jgi:hypothetical protein
MAAIDREDINFRYKIISYRLLIELKGRERDFLKKRDMMRKGLEKSTVTKLNDGLKWFFNKVIVVLLFIQLL